MNKYEMNQQILEFDIIFYIQFNDIFYDIQMKKILNYSHCSQAEHELRFLQNLEQDFKVHQSLIDNTSINNHRSYVSILNQISFNNKKKKQQIKHLMYQSRCYSSQTQQSTMANSFQSKDFKRWRELAHFQKKIIKQEEVKNHLLTQLKNISKSINLMKGDVSRIIEKKQSTILLQKKTSKVELIVQDQLKKVNNALHKDHSQIIQTNNMQIKFNSKLKNICNSEKKSLKRIKSEFLRGEQRKKFINDKISKMEDIMKNLNERETIRQNIRVISEKNKANFQQIYILLDFIKNLEANESDSQNNQWQKDQNLLNGHLSLRTQRFKQKLKNTQNQIVKFIDQVIHSMEMTYNQLKFYSQRAQEYKNKLQQFNDQQKAHQLITNGGPTNITEQQKWEYDHKLTQLKKSLGSLLIMWYFIQNHPKFTKIIDEHQHNDLKASKKQFFPSKYYRKSEDFQKNNSVINQDCNYANQFYKLILYLSDNDQQTDPQIQLMIKSIEMTIIFWIKGLKTLIMEQKKLGKLLFLKKAKGFEHFNFKCTLQLMEEMGEPQPQKYRLSVEQSQEEYKLKTMLQLISPKKGTILSIDQKKMKQHTYKTQDKQGQKSKRVKVLEKFGHDYYQMLKNVFKIQKQTTKNNYNFNRKFNRAKFTQKNIVQEQKRYQSNFALQYIRQQEESMALFSKRSNVSKQNPNNQHFKKAKGNNHKIDHFNKNPVVESSIRFKNLFLMQKKLQSQSKLIRKKSKDQSNKQSNNSVFFSRCNKKIFADKSLHQFY